MSEYIDVTPTWEEILPTWLMLYARACECNVDDPVTIIANTHAELKKMARAADKWNAHCKEQKS